MNSHDLSVLEDWFDSYSSSFLSGVEEDDRNISLKIEHTANVCRNMELLTARLPVDADDRAVAAATALLHDTGRFEQYRRYKTFRDSDSISHAALGATILQEQGDLRTLPDEERSLILQVVGLHSAFAVPRDLDERQTLFLRLVRDADKLDIWRVFVDYYRSSPTERASAAGLGFPDAPFCSEPVVSELIAGRVVRLSSLQTLNDFKLLQLSWVYDLNFAPSFILFRDRELLDGLAETLPDTPEIARCVATIRSYVALRAGE